MLRHRLIDHAGEQGIFVCLAAAVQGFQNLSCIAVLSVLASAVSSMEAEVPEPERLSAPLSEPLDNSSMRSNSNVGGCHELAALMADRPQCACFGVADAVARR